LPKKLLNTLTEWLLVQTSFDNAQTAVISHFKHQNFVSLWILQQNLAQAA